MTHASPLLCKCLCLVGLVRHASGNAKCKWRVQQVVPVAASMQTMGACSSGVIVQHSPLKAQVCAF
jgi:hypothetical protein